MHVVQFDSFIKNVELVSCQHLTFPMRITCREDRRGVIVFADLLTQPSAMLFPLLWHRNTDRQTDTLLQPGLWPGPVSQVTCPLSWSLCTGFQFTSESFQDSGHHIYQANHGQAPAYISDMLHLYVISRSLRSSNQGLVAVPCTGMKTKGDRAFETVAPRLSNALPPDLRAVTFVTLFKKQLKVHLLDRHFISHSVYFYIISFCILVLVLFTVVLLSWCFFLLLCVVTLNGFPLVCIYF